MNQKAGSHQDQTGKIQTDKVEGQAKDKTAQMQPKGNVAGNVAKDAKLSSDAESSPAVKGGKTGTATGSSGSAKR